MSNETTIEIDLSAPLEVQWRSVVDARETVNRILKETKPRSAKRARVERSGPKPDLIPFENIKQHDLLGVVGEKGEFKVDSVDVNKRVVLVWGGEKNRQKYRTFDGAREFYNAR